MIDPVSIATIASQVLVLGWNLIKLIEKLAQNNNRLTELSRHIIISLETLEELSRNNPEPSQLRDSLTSVQTALEQAFERCQPLLKSGLKSKFKAWMNQDDIELELQRIDRMIAGCHHLFTVTTSARLEQQLTAQRLSMKKSQEEMKRNQARMQQRHAELKSIQEQSARRQAEMQNSLRVIEDMLARSIAAAENDPLKAQLLLGMESMTYSEKRQALKAAKKHMGSPRFNNGSLLQRRYMRMKVKTLEDSLYSRSDVDSVTSRHSSRVFSEPISGLSQDHYSNPGNEDPVLETASLLTSRRVAGGEVSRSPQTARNLAKLSNVLDAMGLHDEAAKLNGLGLQLFNKSSCGPIAAWYLSKSREVWTQNKREDAIKLSHRATAMYRDLLKADPNSPELRADFAFALLCHAVYQLHQGRKQEALVTAQECVQLVRTLKHFNAGKLQEWLGHSLVLLSDCLFSIGNTHESEKVALQAVEAFRAVTCPSPRTFANLAKAFGNLSKCHAELKHWRKAISTGQQGICVLRNLIRTVDGAELQPVLADALLLVAEGYSRVGQHQDAFNLLKEAEGVYCGPLSNLVNDFSENIAYCRRAMSRSLISLRQYHPALRVIEKTLEIYRAGTLLRFDANSWALPRDTKVALKLAALLEDAATCYDGLWQHTQAAAVLEKAVAIRASLIQEDPRSAPSLYAPTAASMMMAFHCYRKLKLNREALDMISRATELYSWLHRTLNQCGQEYATGLYNKAVHLTDMGQHVEAWKVIREVRRDGSLKCHCTSKVEAGMCRVLLDIASNLCTAGLLQDAVEVCRESVSMARKLVNQGKGSVYANDLNNGLGQLANCYELLGLKRDAKRTRAEAGLYHPRFGLN